MYEDLRIDPVTQAMMYNTLTFAVGPILSL